MSAVDAALSTQPHVLGEHLLEPGYDKAERISVISLSVTRRT